MKKNETEQLDWTKVFNHFDEVRQQYQELAGMPGVNTSFALEYVFRPIAERYENGERSRELFDEMISVQ